jgi:hypothetical protein
MRLYHYLFTFDLSSTVSKLQKRRPDPQKDQYQPYDLYVERINKWKQLDSAYYHISEMDDRHNIMKIVG